MKLIGADHVIFEYIRADYSIWLVKCGMKISVRIQDQPRRSRKKPNRITTKKKKRRNGQRERGRDDKLQRAVYVDRVDWSSDNAEST